VHFVSNLAFVCSAICISCQNLFFVPSAVCKQLMLYSHRGSKTQLQQFDKGMDWDKWELYSSERVQGSPPARCLTVMHIKWSMKLASPMTISYGLPISLTILHASRVNTEREEHPEPFQMNKVLIFSQAMPLSKCCTCDLEPWTIFSINMDIYRCTMWPPNI
jgi:hypothetical protein